MLDLLATEPKGGYSTEIENEIEDEIETSNDLNVADQYKSNSLKKNQEIAENLRHMASIMVLSVTGGLNISTIIRTSHNLGFKENIVFGKESFDRRGLVGAQNYSNITKISGLTKSGKLSVKEFKKVMDEKELFPIFVETGGTDITEIHWGNQLTRYMRLGKRNPCFVFGNENSGIPANILKTVDNYSMGQVVSIPMLGVMRSFNVSTAASIIMWDYVAKMGLV